MADPLETRQTANADDEAMSAVRGIIGGLQEVDESGDGLTCREIIAALNHSANADRFLTMRELVSDVATRRGAPDSQRLSYVFRKYRGRVAGGYRLEAQSGHGGTNRWRVIRADGGDGGDGGDPFATPSAPAPCVTPAHSPATHPTSTAPASESSPPSPPSPPTTAQAPSSDAAPQSTRIIL